MGVFRVIVCGRINGSDETRTVYTLSASAPGLPTDANLQTWLNTLYTEQFLAWIHQSWQTERYIVEEPVNGKWEYRFENPYIKQGAITVAEAMPNQIAAVVIGVTASRRRGKKFLPGMSEGNFNAGVLVANAKTQYQNFANAYVAVATMGAATVTPGVCKPDGSDFIAFSSGRVDTIAGTQRRRKQGLGS